MRMQTRRQSCGRTLVCSIMLAGLLQPPHAQAAELEDLLVPERPAEITPAIEESVERGLRYLADNQNPDGSWRSGGPAGAYPTAMTALAGLALLASGSTPTTGPYAPQVSRALTSILAAARADGLIARLEEESHCMHGHGFAMLFLAECYGMEEDPRRQAEIRVALQRGVELTARSQSVLGGWLYTPDSQGDEGSVTVTQVQALRAARNAGIAVPKKVIDEAMAYLDRSTNPDGGIRYQARGGGGSRPPLTAAAVVCWFNAGIYEDPRVTRALELVERTLSPREATGVGHYFYAHLYAAQAWFLHSDEEWVPYFRAMSRQLLQLQASNGAWQGDSVGPTYGTAIALLILQLPYKHLPIMQR